MDRQIQRLTGVTIGGRDHYLFIENQTQLFATRAQAEAFVARWQLIEGLDFTWVKPGQFSGTSANRRSGGTFEEFGQEVAKYYGFQRRHLPNYLVFRVDGARRDDITADLTLQAPNIPSWNNSLPCTIPSTIAGGFWEAYGDPNWQPIVKNQPEGYIRYAVPSTWYTSTPTGWTNGFTGTQGPPMLESFRSAVADLYVPQRVDFYTLPSMAIPIPMRLLGVDLPIVELADFTVGGEQLPPRPKHYLISGIRFLRMRELVAS